MKLPKLTKHLSIALGLSAAILSPALAQDDEAYTLSPFTVTAAEGYTATSTISGTGLNTPLINVPMAINVITSDFLDDSHIGEFTHALDYNSSITQASRNHNGSTRPQTFAIRGFKNSTILLDGVLAGHSLPTQLVDRIEIVKGPNTLYGQAEPGGLINVISKTPKAEQGGRASAIAGTNEWYQFKLDYTVRAMDDRLGLRVMTDQKETNGWRWVDGQKHKFLGVSGSYELAEATQFDFLIAKNEVSGFPTQRATCLSNASLPISMEMGIRMTTLAVLANQILVTIISLFRRSMYHLPLGISISPTTTFCSSAYAIALVRSITFNTSTILTTHTTCRRLGSLTPLTQTGVIPLTALSMIAEVVTKYTRSTISLS